MNLNYENVPQELQQLRQWVLWKYEELVDKKKTKVPYNPRTGRRASTTAPDTWGTFQEACAAMQRGNFQGLGFVFTASDPFVGVDFDHCINAGKLDEWVRQQVESLDSYTEISPSGTGLHVICRGQLPGRSVKTQRVEMYDQDRYFTITGNPYGSAKPLQTATSPLAAIYANVSPRQEKPAQRAELPAGAVLDDCEVIEYAENAKNGDTFRALMAGDMSQYGNDHSRADMALCNILAFWCNGDIEQMDRVFRTSGLFRDKWDRPQKGGTYGLLQLQKAAAERTAVFDPEEYRRQQAVAAPAAAGLQIISAADLAGKHLEPVRYFVDDFLPQGLSMLCAPPKYGKSWFVLDLCLSISRGADFLGHKTHKATCLYLALEDSENRLKGRMLKVLAGDPAPSNFMFSVESQRLDTGLIDQLEAFIQLYPDTGVIVIDILQKIRGLPKRGENVYQYDTREMGLIKALADRHRIAILTVHHTRKNNRDESDPFSMISGTNGLMGSADTSFMLTRSKRADSSAELTITGRDVNMAELILNFNKDRCRWEVVGDSESVKRKEARQEHENNPIVLTLRELVMNEEGKWTGTISELMKQCESITGAPLMLEPRKVSNDLKRIAADLEYYDGITFYRWGNGKNGGGSKYVFSSPVTVEEIHTGVSTE